MAPCKSVSLLNEGNLYQTFVGEITTLAFHEKIHICFNMIFGPRCIIVAARLFIGLSVMYHFLHRKFHARLSYSHAQNAPVVRSNQFCLFGHLWNRLDRLDTMTRLSMNLRLE